MTTRKLERPAGHVYCAELAELLGYKLIADPTLSKPASRLCGLAVQYAASVMAWPLKLFNVTYGTAARQRMFAATGQMVERSRKGAATRKRNNRLRKELADRKPKAVRGRPFERGY